MHDEPQWRKWLCWAAVIMFFTAPILIGALHVIAIEFNWKSDDRAAEFKGVMPVYQTISALVFGLAGLNSFDRFTNGKKPPLVAKKQVKKEGTA